MTHMAKAITAQEKVQAWLDETGQPVSWLARQIGHRHRRTLERWLAGLGGLSMERLILLAAVTGIPVQELAGRKQAVLIATLRGKE